MTELAKKWHSLNEDDKLDIIEQAIDMYSTSEGGLFLRYYKKDNSISGCIGLENSNDPFWVESVSQGVLIDLFGEDYDYDEDDAQTILDWMNNQK